MTIYTNEEQVTLGTDLLVNTPMLWVNGYLQSKITQGLKIGVPFFPSAPNTIDDLTETWIVVDGERFGYQGVKCTFDRLIRMRKSSFPHIKSEQLLYYFYATQEGVTNSMIAVTETVLRLMDREDETAEEINAWAKAKGEIAGHTPKFYFHRFKVYQLQETRDIIDFGTARTYGGNKIIIEFEYHQMPELANP
jgi:hypothetical protein